MKRRRREKARTLLMIRTFMRLWYSRFGRSLGVMRKYLKRAASATGLEAGRGRNALSDVVLAGRLDEGVMHLALDGPIHALIDLVDEGERSFADFGERHKVHDRRKSAFLWRPSSQEEAREGQGADSLLRTGDAQ